MICLHHEIGNILVFALPVWPCPNQTNEGLPGLGIDLALNNTFWLETCQTKLKLVKEAEVRMEPNRTAGLFGLGLSRAVAGSYRSHDSHVVDKTPHFFACK